MAADPDEPSLFKGQDLIHTDIRAARPVTA
jgi:uncharacterized protein with PIN domain